MKNYYKALTALSLLSSKSSRSSVLGSITSSTTPAKAAQTRAMSDGWSGHWKDIQNGGNPRWKITSGESHEKAYAHFKKHVLKGDDTNDDAIKNVSVFCPLAGDDPFVHLLYRKGYSVTAIDLVPEAIEANKQGFGEDESAWTKAESDDGDIVWTHKSGRATLIAGDALKERSNLNNSFDAVYDKDSFGALPIELRKLFCERVADFTKDKAIVYVECKYRAQGFLGNLMGGLGACMNFGPPFFLEKDDLMEATNYGDSKFEYVEGLGTVYELPSMNAVMQQTGHVLRRTRL